MRATTRAGLAAVAAAALALSASLERAEDYRRVPST